jgi:hypothetical protein
MTVKAHRRRSGGGTGSSRGSGPTSSPPGGLAEAVLHIQRTAGNQAVQRRLRDSPPSAFTELVAKQIEGLRTGDGLNAGTEGKRHDVMLLQRKLNDRLPGVALNTDGMFGPLTAKALHRVQASNDLPEEDVVSHDASLAVAEDGYYDVGRRVVWDPSFWAFGAMRTSTRKRQEVGINGKVEGFALLRPKEGDPDKLDITIRLAYTDLHGEAGGRSCDVENGQGTVMGEGTLKDGILTSYMYWINLDGRTKSGGHIHFTDGRGAIVGDLKDSPTS